MKTRYSILFSLMICLAGLALATACQKQEAESKVIRVTRNIGGREGFKQHWNLWKSTFETRNPGWKLELIDLGNVAGSDYYKARLATGDLPEVVMTWQLTGFLADAGAIVPIPDSYYEKIGMPLPAAYKGKRYTSQGGTQLMGIAVNKKMWADIGVTEPPRTWDEFTAGLQKLKDKGYKPLCFGGKEWSASMPAFYMVIANLYDRTVDPSKPSWTIRKDKGEVSFAKDPTSRLIIEKLIYFIDNFTEKGCLSDGYNEEQRDFYGGKYATWMMGCWFGGDLEANKVDFDVDYWPIPALTGNEPVFLKNSRIPSGWAISKSALDKDGQQGEKFQKALSAMECYWDDAVFQSFINGECMLNTDASKVAPKGPKSDWPAAQRCFDSMSANFAKYGSTFGWHRALDDFPPQSFQDPTLRAIVQEIVAGEKDVDKLLKEMDEEWESGRKGDTVSAEAKAEGKVGASSTTETAGAK